MNAPEKIKRPTLPIPGPDTHKYTRGYVAIVEGSMPGAALLAGEAALRSGAGYVALFGKGAGQGLHALVRRSLKDDSFEDDRIGAILIGPGLGRGKAARAALERALASDRPLVIDGDALHLLGEPERLADRAAPTILTPHAGEFNTLFGASVSDRLGRVRRAAVRAQAVVVAKASVTIVAAPDGRAAASEPGNPWLSTAGTGDVLAGAIAGMLAARLDPFEAARAGVWLHGEAARRLGAAFVADDLAAALTGVVASL